MPGSESHGPSRKARSNGQADTSFAASAYRFWQKSYAADYVGLALLLAAYILTQFFIEPFHRMFYLNDPRIQYPHAEVERVPVPWLFVYGGAIPLVVIVAWLAVTRSDIQKAHITVLGLLISLILTTFITDIIKNSVGRPRPDLLARCKAEADTPLDQLVTIDVCTQTAKHTLQDGWRSFPSGHSSFAFSGLGYLGLFLASQVQVLRPRADLGRMLLVLAPFLGAALIAISRLEDYRHDVFDVVVGSLLGATIAYTTWRRHYPSLSSHACTEPYVLQLDTIPKPGFSRIRDEEEMLAGNRDYQIGTE